METFRSRLIWEGYNFRIAYTVRVWPGVKWFSENKFPFSSYAQKLIFECVFVFALCGGLSYVLVALANGVNPFPHFK